MNLSVFDFNEFQLLAFFLVLVRMSAFVVAWPVFDAPNVPMPVKILFSLVLSMMVFPTLSLESLDAQLFDSQLMLAVVREAFIGLCFGFLAKMFFFAVRIAGEIISVSIGLSGSQLFNPAFGAQMSTVEQFKLSVASLFFLSINGHHLFLNGVVDTFRILPLSFEMLNLTGLNSSVLFAQEIFFIGLKMSAPVLVAIFFVNVTMAIIGRTVPQINVLITSLPVNILVGFIVMFVSMPLLIWQMHELLEVTSERLITFVRTL